MDSCAGARCETLYTPERSIVSVPKIYILEISNMEYLYTYFDSGN